MNILKEAGGYLERKANASLNYSIALFAVGVIGLFYSSTTNFGSAYFFFAPLILGGFFLKKFLNYREGLNAEKIVSFALQTLDDCYYLLNDVKFPDGYGNIDHVVLGPNGIFVIETKNWRGQIICEGDEWTKHYGEELKTSLKGFPRWKAEQNYALRSPSKQVKRAAVKIKELIESSNLFEKPLRLWVEGIIVFTNDDAALLLRKPTVPVLKIDELCSYIKNKESATRFSSRELELIGTAILKKSELNRA